MQVLSEDTKSGLNLNLDKTFTLVKKIIPNFRADAHALRERDPTGGASRLPRFIGPTVVSASSCIGAGGRQSVDEGRPWHPRIPPRPRATGFPPWPRPSTPGRPRGWRCTPSSGNVAVSPGVKA